MLVVILFVVISLSGANGVKEDEFPSDQVTESPESLTSTTNYEADSMVYKDKLDEEVASSSTSSPFREDDSEPSLQHEEEQDFSVFTEKSTESTLSQPYLKLQSVAHTFQANLTALSTLRKYKEAAAALSSSKNETMHKATPPEQDFSPPVDDEAAEKFLFGAFSTTTYTNVVASTSTVFFSCLSSTTSQNVCQGRGARRKRFPKSKVLLQETEIINGVESSKDDEVSFAKGNPKSADGNEDKLAFTVWTTSRQTTSVTVYFTNTSTTIRLAYYCLAGGVSYPTFSCKLF